MQWVFFQIVHTATYQLKGIHARCYVNQMDVHCVNGDTSAVCAIYFHTSIANAIHTPIFLVAIKVSGNKTIQNMTLPPTWYNAYKQVLVLSISDRLLINIESTSKHLQILTRNFRISVCKCKLRRKSILYFYTLLVFTMTEQRATLRSEQ